MDGGRTAGSLGRCGAFKRGPAAEPAAETAAQLGTGRVPCSDGSGRSGKALEIRSPNHLKHTNGERQHTGRKSEEIHTFTQSSRSLQHWPNYSLITETNIFFFACKNFHRLQELDIFVPVIKTTGGTFRSRVLLNFQMRSHTYLSMTKQSRCAHLTRGLRFEAMWVGIHNRIILGQMPIPNTRVKAGVLKIGSRDPRGASGSLQGVPRKFQRRMFLSANFPEMLIVHSSFLSFQVKVNTVQIYLNRIVLYISNKFEKNVVFVISHHLFI